jgi:hypothetical protein
VRVGGDAESDRRRIPVPRAIRMLFPDTGECAVADLHEDRAPATCNIVWESLPLEGRTVHGMYSGPELFIRADHLGPAPPENQIHRALPGDVGYWFQAGGRTHSGHEDVVEIVFIYHRGAAIMGPDGQPTWVNHFATIRAEGSEAFYAAARSVRYEGPRRLRIERADEAPPSPR